MSTCRYCGVEVTRKWGNLARHEEACSMRPTEATFELAEVSSEDEPPRFKNAHPRVFLGFGVQVWKRG